MAITKKEAQRQFSADMLPWLRKLECGTIDHQARMFAWECYMTVLKIKELIPDNTKWANPYRPQQQPQGHPAGCHD